MARGLRRGGRIVQSSSRLTSSRDAHWIPHGETATHKSHGDAYPPWCVSRHEKTTNLIYSTSDLHPPRDSAHHWVKRVAEIQKGLSPANCLIDAAVALNDRRKEDLRKGRCWDTNRAISIRFPLSPVSSVSTWAYNKRLSQLPSRQRIW